MFNLELWETLQFLKNPLHNMVTDIFWNVLLIRLYHLLRLEDKLFLNIIQWQEEEFMDTVDVTLLMTTHLQEMVYSLKQP